MKSKRERPTSDMAKLVAAWREKITELLLIRAAVSPADLEYLALGIEKLRDERMKGIITDLIGWEDRDRGELCFIFAILLRVVEQANPSKIREAWQKVGIQAELARIDREQGFAPVTNKSEKDDSLLTGR
jgi:hypothetical protein